MGSGERFGPLARSRASPILPIDALRHNRVFAPHLPTVQPMKLRAFILAAVPTLIAALVSLPCSSAFAADPAADAQWVSAWGTALQSIPQLASPPPLYRAPDVAGRTVRQIVYPGIAGHHVRLRLSNAYGTTPLVIDGVSLAPAVSGNSAAVRPGSARPV